MALPASIILLMLFTNIDSEGQKFLVLDKVGSKKRQRYFVGDELVYKIKDERSVRRDIIVDLVADAIVFKYGYITIPELDYVIIENNRGFLSPDNGHKLILASFAYILLDMANRGSPGIDPKVLPTSGALLGIGTFLSSFRKKKFRHGRKKRIRMVNVED